MKKLRPLGQITEQMELLLEEMTDSHEMQAHEILGIIFLWLKTHRPDSIEIYEDGTNPILNYGPANFIIEG